MMNAEVNSFVDGWGDTEVDACLLLLPELRFVEYSDPRFISTLELIEKRLRRGKVMFRYNRRDDFGYMENSFNICTFWLINALAGVGRSEEARSIFEDMLSHRNHVGLLSEDLHPETFELWGNFPQTYSMVISYFLCCCFSV